MRRSELQEQKLAVQQRISVTKEALAHTLSELRASHSVNEQMALSFDKRLQQWEQQLDGRQAQLRKKQEVDQQRKDVQSVKRAELSNSLSQLQREHEAEEEREGELRETIAMLQEELQGEERRTAGMQAELTRLQQFSSDLTAAGPVLQQQLERVKAKDLHWDEREVEAALRVELQRRDLLMHRVAVLEEADWLRQLHRSERWLQTEHSRHFAPVRAKDVKQRFVLGAELGLMSEELVQQRQRELREEDEREERKAQGLARPSSPHSQSAHGSPLLDPASGNGTWAVPPLQAEPQLSSSLRRSSRAASAAGGRQRAASVIAANEGQAGEQRHAPAQAGAERLQALGKKGGRLAQGASSHFRTQSTLPASWQHLNSAPQHKALTSSPDSGAAKREEQRSAGAVEGGATPLSGATSTRTSTRTSHRESVASSSSRPGSPSAASPVLAHSRPVTGRSSPSLSSMRSPAVLSHRSGRAQPGSRPLTASKRASVSSRATTASRDAGEPKGRAASGLRRGESPFSPAVPAMDPASMIPTTAMRTPTRQHPAISPLQLPGLPPASLLLPLQPSSEADEMLKQLTGRSYEAQQQRLADEQSAVATEQDALTARKEQRVYDQFVINSARKPASARQHTAAAQTAASPRPPIPRPPAGEADAALPRRGHRGAVMLTSRKPGAGPGALTEWLEAQAQQAMEAEAAEATGQQARRRHALMPAAALHKHLSLMMPDETPPLPPAQQPEPAQPAAEPLLPLELVAAASPAVDLPSPARRLAVNVPNTPPPLLSAREMELAALWTPPAAREDWSEVTDAEERGTLTAAIPSQQPAARAAEAVRAGAGRRRGIPDDEQPGRLAQLCQAQHSRAIRSNQMKLIPCSSRHCHSTCQSPHSRQYNSATENETCRYSRHEPLTARYSLPE